MGKIYNIKIVAVYHSSKPFLIVLRGVTAIHDIKMELKRIVAVLIYQSSVFKGHYVFKCIISNIQIIVVSYKNKSSIATGLNLVKAALFLILCNSDIVQKLSSYECRLTAHIVHKASPQLKVVLALYCNKRINIDHVWGGDIDQLNLSFLCLNGAENRNLRVSNHDIADYAPVKCQIDLFVLNTEIK